MWIEDETVTELAAGGLKKRADATKIRLLFVEADIGAARVNRDEEVGTQPQIKRDLTNLTVVEQGVDTESVLVG